MSRNTVIALGVAVLAAALLFWFKVRGGEDKAKDKAAEATLAQPVNAKSSDSAREGSNSGQGGGEMEVLFDDDPEGGLRLEGQVITADELPVAGALVAIDSRPPRVVTTEEDGSFAFDKLVSRNYDLVARAAEGVAGPITARPTETNDPVILHLSEGGKVSVKVRSANKAEPIANAKVELRSIDVQVATTDDTGTAVFTQVPVDRFEVRASADGFAPSSDRVAITRPGASTDVELQLKAGAPVSGIVIDADGKPLEGARVVYQGASGWSLRADERLDGVDSDSKGRFTFKALPKGSFRFNATAEGHAPGSSSLVALSGTSETTGVEIQMERAALVRGRVINKAGQPVAAARVRVGIKTAGMRGGRRGGGGDVRQVFSDDDGRFEITGLPRREHELVALHETASSQIVEADLSKAPYEADLELLLDVDGVIAGVVVDSQDEPIAGAQVVIFPDFRRGSGGSSSDWRMRGMNQELTDAGGRFRSTGLKAGEAYQVRAVPPNSTDPSRAWLGEGVEASVGDENVRVVLPKDGGIKGKVAYANGSVPEVFTVSVGWQSGTPFSSKDGSFELSDLPPQSFTVTVRGDGLDQAQKTDVVVSEGKVTDVGTITVSQGRSLTGRVVDSNGSPVPGAQVSAGRVIFGDGSSAQTSGSRNPMARGTKTVTTDDSGNFGIRGLGLGDISLVADHETIGRSEAITYQQTSASVSDLTLVLKKTGALQGIVRKAGVPEPDIIIIATSVSAPAVTFNVASGQDGSYRFDRLIADTYRVKAMFGGSPMQGMSFAASQTTVQADKTSTLDLNIDDGGANLTVSLQPNPETSADKTIGFVRFSTLAGVVQASTARELETLTGAGTGYEGFSMSIAGRPAVIRNLKPGTYTVCAIVFPSEVEGMSGTMDYMTREGDNLATQCTQVKITAEAEQSLEMTVDVPAFVPAPESGE